MSDFNCNTEKTYKPNERIIKITGALCTDKETCTVWIFNEHVSDPLLNELSNDLDKPYIIIDLSALREIDSSGVGALSKIWKTVTRKGGTVAIKGLTGQPAAIFSLLRLGTIYTPASASPR